jgi:predicted PurR-regulated permease PerM
LEIHPLAAIFAVLVGAEIGGIVGIYLAVPLTAAFLVVWRRYVVPKRSAEQTHQSTTKSAGPSSLAQVATN